MLYYAKITNIEDPNKKGYVQVRVYPNLADLDETLLPWAKPMMNSYEEQNLIPNVGSLVYVDVNDDWTEFHYTTNIPYVIDHYTYEDIERILKDIPEVSSFSYPNPDFKRHPNGFIEFYNKINSETGFIHPSGTYFIYKENGDIWLKNPSMFEIHLSDKKVDIQNIDSLEVGSILSLNLASKKVDIQNVKVVNINASESINLASKSISLGEGSDSAVLFSQLKNILTTLSSHTHAYSDTTPSGSVPSTTGGPSGTYDIDSIESSLVTLD